MVKIEELNWKEDNPASLHSTRVGNVVVSTVKRPDFGKTFDAFLGLIQDIIPGAKDEIFDADAPGDYETMVFKCDGNGDISEWKELEFSRYHTEREADEGHTATVERWKNK